MSASWTGCSARWSGCAYRPSRRRGSLYGRRRGHRGGLRPAHRHPRRPVRLPDRPDARQLSEPGQPQAPSGLIGPARVKDIIFTARLVGAEEALAIGLVGEMVEDRAALTERVDALAQLLARHAPLTMQATKEGLRRLAEEEPPEEGAAHPGDDLILMCYMSQDSARGWKRSSASVHRTGPGVEAQRPPRRHRPRWRRSARPSVRARSGPRCARCRRPGPLRQTP